MFVLGLVLVVLAVVAALGVLASGGAAAPLPMFGVTVQGTTVAAVFLTGVVVAVVFFLGLALLGSSTRRSRQPRRRSEDAQRGAAAQPRSANEPKDANTELR